MSYIDINLEVLNEDSRNLFVPKDQQYHTLRLPMYETHRPDEPKRYMTMLQKNQIRKEDTKK